MNLIKICVWTCDTTSRSYFGKMNSILGSVVPLAMFFLQIVEVVSKWGHSIWIGEEPNLLAWIYYGNGRGHGHNSWDDIVLFLLQWHISPRKTSASNHASQNNCPSLAHHCFVEAKSNHPGLWVKGPAPGGGPELRIQWSLICKHHCSCSCWRRDKSKHLVSHLSPSFPNGKAVRPNLNVLSEGELSKNTRGSS